MMWPLIVASALAQGAPAGAPSPAVPPAAAPPASTPPAADPPSLDEALGLGGAKKPTTDDQHAEDLKRSLEGAKPRDILASALDDMRRSETLLEANGLVDVLPGDGDLRLVQAMIYGAKDAGAAAARLALKVAAMASMKSAVLRYMSGVTCGAQL